MNQRSLLGAAALALTLVSPAPADASPIVERIKSGGVIRCGGVSRPGLLGQSPEGKPYGLYLDLCRAIGATLLGPDGRMVFQPLDSNKAFDAVRSGGLDVAFLDGSEILDQDLAKDTALGPAVAFLETAAMVREDSPVKTLADLAGRSVCFYQGSNAHRHLEAWAAAQGHDVTRMGYTEYGEMVDAYEAGKCEAQVGELGELAVARAEGHAKGIKSRILPEPLAIFPVFALTLQSDPQWSAIVTWAIVVLQRAELRPGPWTVSGIEQVPVKGAALGVAEDWRKRVLGAAGSYADIYARNLGEASRLRLPRGPMRRSRRAASW